MRANHYSALLKRNQNIPRYTSYPTAPHFHAGINGQVYKTWLQDIEADAPLSLYIHIPFCKKLCWYCGCHTKATALYQPVSIYLDYLKKEITLTAAEMQESSKRKVSHIHFGGGSPSYLSASDFTSLMDHINHVFSVDTEAEIAIELDPREITEAKVAAYSKAGVNRASLGVQDFHIDVQKAINRVQPLNTVYRGLDLLRQYGIKACNMDLLYGLPVQTSKHIRDNIAYALMLKPSRISLFGYAHVPWMKKHMRLIDEMALPGAEERLRQFDLARNALIEGGYQQIGLDHFVQKSDPLALQYQTKKIHRNFQGYTADTAENLLGFGASAISSLPQGYSQNKPDIRAYYKALDAGDLPATRGIKLTPEDHIRRLIIQHIMCYGEFSLKDFTEKRDSRSSSLAHIAFQQAKIMLQELAVDGLIDFSEQDKAFTVKIAQASRLAASVFDSYLQPKQAQHSQIA
ncbi:oxygen-independent coproporphyrinogen III oxidase [Kordiimonas pumila]|uniref:Coproporphyrinogen-III oxidase n=1 Tax=Kordiimonas pumila TaxID=2161677 RepID=A0ABV7D6C9_9PROT|nr:oxygen-independent coproporphyrinogen III oxidase [Kordiimonas pumila]